MEAEIYAHIPDIDPCLVEYAAGYMKHAAASFVTDADALSPLDEAVSDLSALLVSASGNFSPDNTTIIRNLVDKFAAQVNGTNGANGRRAPSVRKLEQAIQVGSQRNVSSTLGLTGGNVDLESANTRKVESRVDRKKLEKAERKIKAKQDRKVMKNVAYEASRLLNQPDDQKSYEEFFMTVNPLQMGSESSSKSKDIKLDAVDISIAGKRILTDATLSLSYGRRYGLVGQNGIGKSTLLRALSRREVAIPTHISILHVEQEVSLLRRVKEEKLSANFSKVHGDDTPALQAVLDADVWRKHLLREQDVSKKDDFISNGPAKHCAEINQRTSRHRI